MRRIDHTAFGAHSRIPPCCVAFFVDTWQGIFEQDNNPYVLAVRHFGGQYVPCPSCLATGKPAKILHCSVACGGDHVQDFELAF